MSIGDNIRNARIKKKMNQKELADMLTQNGVSIGNTTISNWENGTSKPDPDTIALLCEILDVDANYILGFNNNSDNTIDNERQILFDKAKKIMSDDDWETIEFIMKKTINNYEKNKNNQ